MKYRRVNLATTISALRKSMIAVIAVSALCSGDVIAVLRAAGLEPPDTSIPPLVIAGARPPVRSSFYDGTANSVATFAWQPQFNSTVEMTVQAWVYREEAHPARLYPIISQEDSFAFYFWGNFLAFNRGRAGTIAVATIEVPIHQWTHVAASYDGTRVRFYVGGEAAGNFALGNNGVGANFRLLLGGMGSSYFNGWLDEVQLWSAARPQTTIQKSLYTESRSGATLKAVWPEGGAREALAGLSAAGENRPKEDIFGILPRDLVVPEAAVVPQIDGIVDLTAEYRGAEQLVIRYSEGERVRDAVAYLTYKRTGLPGQWTLQVGVPYPSDTVGQPRDQSWIGLLLDPDNSKDDLAQTSDFEVGASLGRANSFYRVGTGTGGYLTPSDVPPQSQWKTARFYGSSDINPPSIEFQIAGGLLGSLTETNGLAIGHHRISNINDNRFGPGDAVFNSPATWANVTYGGAAAEFPRVTFRVSIRDAGTGELIRTNRVFLRNAENTLVMLGETTSAGPDGWYNFDRVSVPPGVPVQISIETCAFCAHDELPLLVAGTGLEPRGRTTDITPTSVIFPPCTSTNCSYQYVEFRVRRPLPPITATAFSPTFGNPQILLRNEPEKILQSTEITLTGENFHDRMQVFLYDCPEIPPLSDCSTNLDYFELQIKEGTLSNRTVIVTIPEEAYQPEFESRLFRIVIKDNWIRPGVRVGMPGEQWITAASGARFIVTVPYPKVHGFDFFNYGGAGDWKLFTSVYGRDAFSRFLRCPPRPLYLVWFPIFLKIMEESGGSCVGMASSSRRFANGSLNPLPFGANYAAGFPSGERIEEDDGDVYDPAPPRPARFRRVEPCGPWDPANLWAVVRRNHGAQFTEQFLREMVSQLPDRDRPRNASPAYAYANVRSAPSRYVLCMRRDGGGHAVTPYGVINGVRFTWGDREGEAAGQLVTDANYAVIRIYDNNNPGDTNRYINVNLTENTFHYRFEDGRFKYRGKGLFTIPISLWDRDFTRPFILHPEGWLVHFIMGDADVSHETSDSRRWGWDAAGNFTQNYAGGFDIPGFHGDDSQELRNHAFITAPGDAPTRSIINVRGPDYYFHADQGHTIFQLHVTDGRTNDQDQVQLQLRDNRFSSLQFLPGSARSNFVPTVGMEFSGTESASFAWSGLQLRAGESISFEALRESKAVRCLNKSPQAARYTLTVNSADEAAGLALVQNFGPFELPPGASHKLALAEWPRLDAVRLELDLNADGVPERIERIANGPQPEPPTRFMNVPYSPEGDALIQNTAQGDLSVDRLLDDDGTDGVKFYLAGAQSVSVAFRGAPEAVQVPDSGLQTAILHGPSTELLAVIESVDIGSQFQHKADFSASGSATATVRIFDGANLALELKGYSGSIRSPAGIGGVFRAAVQPDGQLSASISWAQPLALVAAGGMSAQAVNAGGQSVKADQIVWISESAQPRLTPNSLDTLTLSGFQVPSFVTNITVDRAASVSLRFTHVGDALDLEWQHRADYMLMTSTDLREWKAVSAIELQGNSATHRVDLRNGPVGFYQLRSAPNQ